MTNVNDTNLIIKINLKKQMKKMRVRLDIFPYATQAQG